MKIGVVILAAGPSTRLGSPKQLLLFRGEPLVRRAAQAALGTSCRPVTVVLGANAEEVRAPLADLDVKIVKNAFWPQGMGTSVRIGLAALDGLVPGGPDAALLLVCDQPLLGASDLLKLVIGFKTAPPDKQIAAAKYGGTVGVPAIFGRAHFPALRELPDDSGAKEILLRQPDAVWEVELPNAAFDVDTRAEFEALAG